MPGKLGAKDNAFKSLWCRRSGGKSAHRFAPARPARTATGNRRPADATGWGRLARPSQLPVRQALRPGDRRHAQPHQDHLSKTRARVDPTMQARDQPGDRYIEEARRRQCESIRKRADRSLEPKVRGDAANDGGQASGHVHDQSPAARHARVDQDREVADPVGDLMRGDGKRGHKAERETRQEGCCDQDAVESVVDAVADDDQDTRRRGAAMVVTIVVRMPVLVCVPMVVPVMRMPNAMVVPVVMRVSGLPTRLVTIRPRVPPQHQLLDEEEHAKPHEQRDPDGVRAFRPDTRYRFRQQCKQCGAEQRPRRVADEVRHEAPARCLRHQKKQARERRAGYAADSGKENDPDEQRQGLCASLRV